MPSLAQALAIAFDGWDCRVESGPATSPWAPISASQVRPSSSALALLITTTAAAPSEICEEEPAVMVPSLANAGRSWPRVSAVVSARMPSSSLNCDRVALALRDLDRHDLVVEQAVLPGRGGALVGPGGERVLLRAGDAELGVVRLGELAHRRMVKTSHRPSYAIASTSFTSPYLKPSRDFGSRCGALVIDSMPPATTMSNSPARISWSASAMASRPDRQTLLIVSAGTVIGMPALTAAWRAGIWPAPACSTWPMITYSTWSGAHAGPLQRGLDRDAAEVGAGEVLERAEQPAHRGPGAGDDDGTSHGCNLLQTCVRTSAVTIAAC